MHLTVTFSREENVNVSQKELCLELYNNALLQTQAGHFIFSSLT
jgi:hypothetical protein